MKLSFATLGCPGWTLANIAANAKNLGYQGIELRAQNNAHIGIQASTAERKEARSLFEKTHVEIAALMGYTNFVLTDADSINEQNTGAIGLLELAHDLNCPILRIFFGLPGDEPEREELFARVARNIEPVIARAQELGVKMAIETHDAWTEGESVMRVLERVDSPNLGVCWDVCNSYFVEPIDATFQSISSRIIHVHLKDEKRTNGSIAPVLPGNGEVNLARAVELLVKSGYSGYYSFEWEKWWHPELAEPEEAFAHYIKFCETLG